MNKDFIFFDLDGTLTDPKIGITKSVQYSLKAFGIDVADTEDLINFIGPPLRDSYKMFYSFSDDEAERAVEKYREYFTEYGLFENTVYDGIPELLKSLYESRKSLAIATSKPTVYAQRILEYFAIDRYFLFVAGSELDGRRSKKDLVIQFAMDSLKIESPDRVIMIGDREHDVIGANALGMDSIGVLYGYGGYDELSKAGATFIAQDVHQLARLLCPAI